MRCGYCGAKTHTLKNCPKTHGGSVHYTRMRCSYCGAKNHTIEACPKTHGGNAKRAWNPESVADHFVLDKDEDGKPKKESE